MSEQRFPRLAPEQMTPRQREVAQQIAAGPRGEVKGPFLALLHNPDLAERIQQLGEHLRFGTELPGEVIELAVLVAARVWDCQYEWAAHRRIATATTSLAPEIMDAIAAGRDPGEMPGHLRDAYVFCMAVHRLGQPGEAACDAVEARYGKRGVLDLLALCGYYTMLAMVLNTAQVPLPDGAAPPLEPLRRP